MPIVPMPASLNPNDKRESKGHDRANKKLNMAGMLSNSMSPPPKLGSTQLERQFLGNSGGRRDDVVDFDSEPAHSELHPDNKERA